MADEEKQSVLTPEERAAKTAKNKRKRDNKKAKKHQAEEKKKEEEKDLLLGDDAFLDEEVKKAEAAKTTATTNATRKVDGGLQWFIPEVTPSNHNTLGIKIDRSPNKRLGLFSTRGFLPGDWILREKPLVYASTSFLCQEACYNVLRAEHKAKFNLLHKTCVCHERVCRETIASRVWRSCGLLFSLQYPGRPEAETTVYSPTKRPRSGKQKEKNKKEDVLEWPARVAVYEAVSRINHACDPNVVCAFTTAGEVALQAVKHIRKGEELTRCYLAAEEMDKKTQYLPERFGFHCECDDCLLGETLKIDFEIEKKVQAALDGLQESSSGDESDTDEEKKFGQAHIWAAQMLQSLHKYIDDAVKEIKAEARQPHAAGAIVEKYSAGVKIGELIEAHRRDIRERNEFGLSEKAITQQAKMSESDVHEILMDAARDEENRAVFRAVTKHASFTLNVEESSSSSEDEVEKGSDGIIDLGSFVDIDGKMTWVPTEQSKSLDHIPDPFEDAHIANVEEDKLHEYENDSTEDGLGNIIKKGDPIGNHHEDICANPAELNTSKYEVGEEQTEIRISETSNSDRKEDEVDNSEPIHDEGKDKEKEPTPEPGPPVDDVTPTSNEQQREPKWIFLRGHSDDSSDSSSDSSSEDSDVISVKREPEEFDVQQIEGEPEATVEDQVLRLAGKIGLIVIAKKEGESSTQGANTDNESQERRERQFIIPAESWEKLVKISKGAGGRILM